MFAPRLGHLDLLNALRIVRLGNEDRVVLVLLELFARELANVVLELSKLVLVLDTLHLRFMKLVSTMDDVVRCKTNDSM